MLEVECLEVELTRATRDQAAKLTGKHSRPSRGAHAAREACDEAMAELMDGVVR